MKTIIDTNVLYRLCDISDQTRKAYTTILEEMEKLKPLYISGSSGFRVELKTKIQPPKVEEYRHPKAFSVPESTCYPLNTLNT